MILQLDDRARAEVKLAAARLYRIHDDLITQPGPGHRHQVHVRNGLLGSNMLIVLRLSDRRVTFLVSILGVTCQSTDGGASQGTHNSSARGMTALATDQGSQNATDPGPDHGAGFSMVSRHAADRCRQNPANYAGRKTMPDSQIEHPFSPRIAVHEFVLSLNGSSRYVH